MKNIFIELFRFDKETDYLPYFRKFDLKVDENMSVNGLLELLNTKEEFGFNENCNLKINNLFLNSSEILNDVIEKVGCDLKIEPVSTYRSTKDLIIDNSDFIEKTNIFADFLTQDELSTYISSCELEYYASNTLNFNKAYIGDHVLYIASDIIAKNSELKAEVLDIIDDKEKGIYFHTSLKNRLFRFDAAKEQKIEELFSMMPEVESFENSIIEAGELSNASKPFDGFNVAVYEGGLDLNLKELVEKSGANIVELSSKDYHIPNNAFKADEKFPLLIAAEVLLEAKDADADFILVGDMYSFSTLDAKQKQIEKYSGREISLPIVTKSQFAELINGQRDKKALGFDKHKVNVTFI